MRANAKFEFWVTGVLLLSACAPVASSVPKIAKSATTPFLVSTTETPVIIDRYLESKVISADEYDAFEKKLDADYVLQRFDERDARVIEFRKRKTMKEVEAPAGLKHAEMLMIFIVKTDSHRSKFKGRVNATKLKLETAPSEKGKFSISVSAENEMEPNDSWNEIQENLISVVLASREARVLIVK